MPPPWVAAPHSLGLFGEGAVTVPPVPPGGTPSAAAGSSNLVFGHATSSTTIVHACAEPTMSQRQPQPTGVEDVLAEGRSGPTKPAGTGAGLQKDAVIDTSPLAGSTVTEPSEQRFLR